MTIDWGKPLEAVHEDGRRESVRLSINCQPLSDGSYYIGWPLAWLESERRFQPNGEPCKTTSPWRIRNVPEHPTPKQYAPELVERMVALVRRMYPVPASMGTLWDEARSIVSDLPQQVDPDLVKAVQLIDARGINEDDLARHTAIEIAEEAIRLGRQLQRGEAA